MWAQYLLLAVDVRVGGAVEATHLVVELDIDLFQDQPISIDVGTVPAPCR